MRVSVSNGMPELWCFLYGSVQVVRFDDSAAVRSQNRGRAATPPPPALLHLRSAFRTEQVTDLTIVFFFVILVAKFASHAQRRLHSSEAARSNTRQLHLHSTPTSAAMDNVLSRLLDKAWDRFLKTPSDTRFCESSPYLYPALCGIQHTAYCSLVKAWPPMNK